MGVKYRIRYHLDEWRTEIHVPSYEGDVIEVKGVGQTAGEIHYEDGEHIKSSKFNLSFYTDVDLYDLQTCNDLECVVKVWHNNNLYWSGFILPDGIKQPDRDIMAQVDLIASDGLNLTKDLKIVFPEIELPIEMPTYTSELRTPLHYLLYVLKVIDNELPIRWSCSTKSLLDETKDAFCGVDVIERADFLMYKDVDAYFILENILKSFNLKIYQTNGVWYVINELDVQNEFKGFEYVFGTVVVHEESTIFTPDEYLTNDNYFEVQKGFGSCVVKYNPIKDVNVIPNGDFNSYIHNETGADTPLYWYSTLGNIYSSAESEYRISMRKTDDFGREERSCIFDNAFTFVPSFYYFKSPIDEYFIPIDGHNLYKDFNLSFRIMPALYPTYPIGHEKEGKINWLDFPPFSVQVRYTAEDLDHAGIIRTWYLSEFGYWIPYDENYEGLKLESKSIGVGRPFSLMVFTGKGLTNQILTITEFFADRTEKKQFEMPMDFFDTEYTIDFLVSEDLRFSKVDSQTMRFTSNPDWIKDYTVSITQGQGIVDANWINLIVENAINEDVIEYQFQSKANQGKIVLPDCGDIMPDGRGHFHIAFKQKGGVRTIIDNLKVTFEDVTETYTLNLPDNKNTKEEFEMRISSSFNGLDLTSYMKEFSSSEDYMLHSRNGAVATLTEHYGRDFLRLNARPRRTYTTRFTGEMKPYQHLIKRGIKFVPLSMQYNTETNQTYGKFIEIVDNNIDNIEVKIDNGKTNN